MEVKNFRKFIGEKVYLEPQELDLVISKCRLKVIPKGKLVLKAGQIANQYYYIVKGGLRFYYEFNDRETTTWICFQNEFFTEISSLHPQKPTRFNIQAIGETELIVLDKKDMDFLYAYIPGWDEFGRKIWEATAARMIDQLLNFQTLSAEERYLRLLSTPEMLQKIPINQLASILGITPNALSRIRNKIR